MTEPDENDSLERVVLHFSCGPGAAGVRSDAVTSAINVLHEHGLRDQSDGMVSRAEGDINTIANAVRDAIITSFGNGASHFRMVVHIPELDRTRSDEVLDSFRSVAGSLSAEVVPLEDMVPRDVPLEVNNRLIGGIKEIRAASQTNVDPYIEPALAQSRTKFGTLVNLNAGYRRQVLNWLDERGVFQRRRSIETVAKAMNVSRATVYNDLKALRG